MDINEKFEELYEETKLEEHCGECEMGITEEVSVKDVSGAGDTFISGLVVEYVKTKDIKKAINFAQECTTKVVQQIGVVTI